MHLSNCRKIFRTPDLRCTTSHCHKPRMSQFSRQATALPAPPMQPAVQSSINQKRQLQQFYLHKLFDLELDVEFLPLIPQDPVGAAIQMQESMAMQKAQYAMSPGMSPLHRQEAMALYNQAAQRSRRHSNQFLQQHLFGGKRANYTLYRNH